MHVRFVPVHFGSVLFFICFGRDHPFQCLKRTDDETAKHASFFL